MGCLRSSRCRPLAETDEAAELSKARAELQAADHAAMRAAEAAAKAKNAALAERVEANKREGAAKLAAESACAQAGLAQALGEEEAAQRELSAAVAAQQAQVPSKRRTSDVSRDPGLGLQPSNNCAPSLPHAMRESQTRSRGEHGVGESVLPRGLWMACERVKVAYGVGKRVHE